MVSIRKLVHALALLAVISLLVAAPTNAAQDGLISASVAGDLPRVKSLLAANADVDAKGLDGSTALIAASFRWPPGGGADLARSQRRCERQVVGHWRSGYKSGHKARLRGDSATPESGRMHS